MKIHHLNCGTLCPPARRLVNGDGGLFAFAEMVCHCLLIETNQGLVLVDTGFGEEDLAHPSKRLGRAFAALTRPVRDPAQTARHQVQHLGFRPEDVRHIVVTHLDLDHAGGLPDFPWAQVHVLDLEQRAALEPLTMAERERYRRVHFAHGPRWSPASPAGERWFGFACVRDLPGLPPEILLVPLLGHTRGHAAVAIQGEGGWLVHAGDAYFHHEEMKSGGCPWGLSLFQKLMAVDDTARRHNQARLRELVQAQAGSVRVFCAHDPNELATLRA
jgi:glyoxylase-like metal-dependent hydrolase (beta-lactamase superfamily II)